jgi:RND family efflux transporter MFP subunit
MKNWLSPQKRGPLLILTGVLIVLIGISVFYYIGVAKEQFPTNQQNVPPKHLTIAEKQKVPLYAVVVGNIMPSLNSTLSAEIPAQVKEVLVKPGDKIEKDQLLLKLDDKQYALELEQAQSEWTATKANFDEADRNYQRTQRLLEKMASTQVAGEKAQTAYENAQSKLQTASKNIERLKIRLEKTNILAPYTGLVGEKFIDSGDYVMPGTPLFIIYGAEPFEIEAKVPENYISLLKIGDEVSIDVDAFHLKTKATITEIIPYGDSKSHIFMVKARLKNQAATLPKAFGKMTFPVGEQEAVLIPVDYIQRFGQLEIITVLTNNVWQRRYVRTGQRFNKKIIILSGLEGGETIGHD